MKSTGMVRKIDPLGRIVIPKELRRTLCILEGDGLEIFVEDDKLCLRKYSPSVTIESALKSLKNAYGDIPENSAISTKLEEIIILTENLVNDGKEKN